MRSDLRSTLPPVTALVVLTTDDCSDDTSEDAGPWLRERSADVSSLVVPTDDSSMRVRLASNCRTESCWRDRKMNAMSAPSPDLFLPALLIWLKNWSTRLSLTRPLTAILSVPLLLSKY